MIKTPRGSCKIQPEESFKYLLHFFITQETPPEITLKRTAKAWGSLHRWQKLLAAVSSLAPYWSCAMTCLCLCLLFCWGELLPSARLTNQGNHPFYLVGISRISGRKLDIEIIRPEIWQFELNQEKHKFLELKQ